MLSQQHRRSESNVVAPLVVGSAEAKVRFPAGQSLNKAVGLRTKIDRCQLAGQLAEHVTAHVLLQGRQLVLGDAAALVLFDMVREKLEVSVLWMRDIATTRLSIPPSTALKIRYENR